MGGKGAASGEAGAKATGGAAGSAGEGAASGMAGGPSSAGGAGETGNSGAGSGGTGGMDAAGTAGSSGANSAGPHLAFAAIGDSGKGSSEAKKVGEAVAAKCLASGCDFVQLLGDNIYDDGTESVSDEQWTTKFVAPFASVTQPFWVVLGNHDYGGNGAGYEDNKADVQVAYSQTNPKWKLPARYYHHVEGPAELFALDTNAIMFGKDDQQRKDLVTWIGASQAPWKIAVGHHPYRSNGKHGNAGSYDGLPSFVPVASGANVKELTEEILCGKVDLYLAGHDHSRQWLKTTCQGTELVVSGAGSGVTTLSGDNPAYFQAKTVGFAYVEVYATKLTITMIDADGKDEYSRTIVK